MPFDTINASHLLRVLFQQPAIIYSLISFLWLFDDVHSLKGIRKFETINTAFVFLSPCFHLSSVTRGKCLCIFFPAEIAQISYRTWNCLLMALLSNAVLHCSSYSAFSIPVSQWDFTTDLKEISWTKIYWLHLSQLKNGLLPSSCPSMVSTHVEAGFCTASDHMWCCPHPQLCLCSVLQGKLCICAFLTFLLTVCPDRFSLESVLSVVLRRQHRTIH